MITWQRIGCIEVAELPDGKTAVVAFQGYQCGDTAYEVRIIGDGSPRMYYDCPDKAKSEIESKYAPKPFDRTETSSYWRSEDGTRTAYVSGGSSTWCLDNPENKTKRFPTREEAESAAAKYVLGEE